MAHLGNMGTPVTNYYPTAGAAPQAPPAGRGPVTATASGSFAQSASGEVALVLHPGLWLVAIFGATLLLLHHGGVAE